jgi:hypothetical protein
MNLTFITDLTLAQLLKWKDSYTRGISEGVVLNEVAVLGANRSSHIQAV